MVDLEAMGIGGKSSIFQVGSFSHMFFIMYICSNAVISAVFNRVALHHGLWKLSQRSQNTHQVKSLRRFVLPSVIIFIFRQNVLESVLYATVFIASITCPLVI